MVRVEVAVPRRSRNHRSSVKRNAPAQIHPAQNHEVPGLRERKKARLRQQIIDTAIRLFRKQGYEKTRVDDIVKILEISQPTFFRYFPSKDAVLRDVGKLAFECVAERLRSELSTKADITERLHRMKRAVALEVEADWPLWKAVVVSGAMDRVRSPEVRGVELVAVRRLRQMLEQGQERGEITSLFLVVHIGE